jgi:hypothetical protein
MSKPIKRLGKLPPQYTFFLNPYDDLKFSRCPQCNGKTQSRKLPLVIWVDPANPVVPNYTCRYCPTDDLLIAHQNTIEDQLARLFAHRAPNVIGNDYLVLGTMEKSAWKEGVQKPISLQDMPEYVHDFKQVVKFDLQYGWAPEEPASRPAAPQPSHLSKKQAPSAIPVTHQAQIDDETETEALIQKMQSSLPISARPSKDLVNLLRKRGVYLDRGRNVQIHGIFYAGDEGGIACDITPLGREKTPVLCSLTHLVIDPGHALAEEIRRYQTERARKLNRA